MNVKHLVSASNLFFKIAQESFHFENGNKYWGKQGSGILIVCLEDKTALLLKRSDNVEQPGTWGIAGGAIAPDEDTDRGAKREAQEELGSLPKLDDLLDVVKYLDGNFTYTTYVYSISLKEKREWSPKIQLNWENSAAKWFPLDALPGNLHFGVKYLKDNFKERGIDVFDDPQDKYDWLRRELRVLMYHSNIPPKLISEAIQKIDPKHTDASILDEIKKFFVSNKDFESVKKINKLILLLKNRPRPTTDREKPRHERASYEQYLYHGTSLADALSILKNNTFVKSGAYYKLSLTPDLTIAGNFGDVVFVFDAKKLQRRGARKIKYLSEEEILKLERSGEIAENLDKSKLPERYMAEKEWYIPLPFTFKNDELVKLIVLGSEHTSKENREKFKYIIESLHDIPVQIMNSPSYSAYSPKISERPEDTEFSDIRFNIMSNLADNFFELKKYVRKIIVKKFDDDTYKINSILREISSNCLKLEDEVTKKVFSREDLTSFTNAEKYFSNSLQDLSKFETYPEIKYLINLLSAVISGLKKISDIFVNKFLSEDKPEKYFLNMWKAPASYFPLIKKWVHDNIDEALAKLKANNYNIIGFDYYFGDYPAVEKIPVEVWKHYPNVLLLNPNIGKLPESTLKQIFYNNPKFEVEGDVVEGLQWYADMDVKNNPVHISGVNKLIKIFQEAGA